MEQKKHNRLINEKSPYLLKHAANPVDWYPWGDEAFARARREDKPVFLSVGYSTCHWCNVMEEESFSDPEVAALMNDAFVSVKVDREERPDIDNIYMTVCQMLTGTGGWPLTVVMTPDRKPFFAGTYYPKHTRGRIGLMELIPRIKTVWEEQREEVFQSADRIMDSLRKQSGVSPGEELHEEALHEAYRELAGRYDEKHGGFGVTPKFPMPHSLMFLLRYWKRTGEAYALGMVENTLDRMRLGGMYDHLGYGFHRYSTDRMWRVPHFEKMLYDQALLAMAFTEAYQATGKEEYAGTVSEIFTHVLRDMASAEGAFHSALSADVEGQEGRFYLWKDEEIGSALTEDEARLVRSVFHIKPEGNFIDEMRGTKTGGNILYLDRPLSDAASSLGAGEHEVREIMRKLYRVREKRAHPEMDDKVLADWNGLMVAALAKGAQALGENTYVKAAARAADFILHQMRDSQGRLLHRWREGQSAVHAHADDYAFLIWGLIELYEACFEVRWLEAAIGLMEDFLKHFWAEEGGFYFTPAYGETLPVRRIELSDAALPSANSVALSNLLRLGRLTGNTVLLDKAAQMRSAFAGVLKDSPPAYTHFFSGLDMALGPAYEVVITGMPGSEDTEAMLHALRKRFIPNKAVIFKPAAEESPEIQRLAGFIGDYGMIEGRAAAYVCANHECSLPTTDSGKMLGLLGEPDQFS